MTTAATYRIVEVLPTVGYECDDMRGAVCAGARPTNGATYVIAESAGCRV